MVLNHEVIFTLLLVYFWMSLCTSIQPFQFVCCDTRTYMQKESTEKGLINKLELI